MIFGANVGMGAVMFAGQLGGLGSLRVPVAVGIGAAAIGLAAHIPLLSKIPACVYRFASIAGLILPKGQSPQDAIVPTTLSIALGAAFGWHSEAFAGMRAAKTTNTSAA
jgi:hypothetical protein